MLISVQRAVAVTLLTLSAVSFAQEPLYPGPNRNIVGPPPADSSALADTGNRQQNEPSCAVDPDNN